MTTSKKKMPQFSSFIDSILHSYFCICFSHVIPHAPWPFIFSNIQLKYLDIEILVDIDEKILV
jgi:hypothetical protein